MRAYYPHFTCTSPHCWSIILCLLCTGQRQHCSSPPHVFFKLPSLFLSEEKLVLFSQCQPHRLLFPALYMAVRWQEWERGCHQGRCGAGGHKTSDLGTGWKKQGSRSPVWLARQRLSTLLFILQVLKYFPTVVFGNSGNFCCHLSWTQNSFPHFFSIFFIF